jgi:hypothetical protein
LPGDRPLPCPTLTRAPAPAPAALALALALAGCAMTTYRPTEPRPVLGPGVSIDVVSVRGAADKAEVLLRTQQPMLIGPVSLSSADHESCHPELPAQSVGRDVRVAEGEQAPPSFVVNGAETVFVDLSGPARPEGPNAFLDFKVDTGSEQGCVRVPLTAATADQTMWRAESPPWSVSLGARIDHPLAPLGGTGARLTSELRVLRPLGPVRGFFGFTLGGAGCRGALCPPESVDQGEDESVTGVFIHYGGELGLDRRFELGGGRALVATLGGNISSFHVGAPPDWAGDKNGAVAGAFASLTLFALGGASAIPGFAPAARRLHSGPELFVHRLTAFGRGPTETAWVVGFGWRLEGTN